jgi:hypothetical protein
MQNFVENLRNHCLSGISGGLRYITARINHYMKAHRHLTIDPSVILNMSDNLSFVLRSIEHVVYEDRPIPESTLECNPSHQYSSLTCRK